MISFNCLFQISNLLMLLKYQHFCLLKILRVQKFFICSGETNIFSVVSIKPFPKRHGNVLVSVVKNNYFFLHYHKFPPVFDAISLAEISTKNNMTQRIAPPIKIINAVKQVFKLIGFPSKFGQICGAISYFFINWSKEP